MKKQAFSQLSDKYLHGDCTPEEKTQLLDWYDLQNTSDPLSVLDVNQKRDLEMRMLANIREKAGYNRQAKQKAGFKAVYYIFSGIAASLLIVLGFIYINNRQQISIGAIKKSHSIVFKNNTNRLSKHILPDKSVIWLKPSAIIQYDTKFVNKYRKVSLKGEAFFEVEKDMSHPFLIYSGGIITRVVGTSFNIKTDEKSRLTEVSVVTGKVFVYTPHTSEKAQNVYLLPEQKAAYSQNSHQLIKGQTREHSLKIWKKKSLTFDNSPVSEVIRTLNESFGSKIRTSDEAINHYTLRADFTNVNLATIMEMLSKSLNLTYQIEGESIIISETPEANLN